MVLFLALAKALASISLNSLSICSFNARFLSAASPSQDKHDKQFPSVNSIPTSWPNLSSQVFLDRPNHSPRLMGVVKPGGEYEKRVVEFEGHTGGASVHSILHPDLKDFQ